MNFLCFIQVRNYSPQAFKFFMEQHVENVIKSHKQRVFRRLQLETEMSKIGLSEEAQAQMRKMLSQKESNYIRLKRAKMDKSMFVKIKPIGWFIFVCMPYLLVSFWSIFILFFFNYQVLELSVRLHLFVKLIQTTFTL